MARKDKLMIGNVNDSFESQTVGARNTFENRRG